MSQAACKVTAEGAANQHVLLTRSSSCLSALLCCMKGFSRLESLRCTMLLQLLYLLLQRCGCSLGLRKLLQHHRIKPLVL